MKITKIFKKGLNRFKAFGVKRASLVAIKDMRAGNNFVKLTKDQEKEVQEYWMKYWGEKIDLRWHEYFYYANKEFSPRYIPVYIKNAYIDPNIKNAKMTAIYSDKNMIDKLVGAYVKLPKTHIKNINGIYYINNKVVSMQEAIQACLNLEDAVIKHSIESCQGKSIIRFKSVDGKVFGKDCPDSIAVLFEQYGQDFIVQDAIKQCPQIASLNPTSLNTIRIMTYWSKSGIVPVFSVIRMGRSGAVVDNASAGGLYCGVNLDDGSLKEFAYTLSPFSTHSTTDSGVALKDFKIPQFNELKEKAIELHSYLPYTKLIGWDLCVDDQNEIELVEINAANPGMFQAATGPAFGDYTEEILEFCRTKK